MYRAVCASSGEKVERRGQLNEFTGEIDVHILNVNSVIRDPACAESPLPTQRYCLRHKDNIDNPNEERLDVGRMTRAKRVELGISIEELTTGQGCRKIENIAVRKSRKKTAGMQGLLRTIKFHSFSILLQVCSMPTEPVG